MKTLIAGIGNIFMGDDGFGCEVVQRLSRHALPEHVDLVDFGIRGMDLSYALMDGYDHVILIDTVDREGPPGSVYLIEPEMDDSEIQVIEEGEQVIAPHEMDPVKVLRFAATLGKQRPKVILVACQPEYLGGEHGHMGLSDSVADAVAQAETEILDLLEAWLPGDDLHRPNQTAPAQPTAE